MPAGVTAEFHAARENSCTGQDIFHVDSYTWVSPEDGLDFYTKGASFNTNFRSAGYPSVEYDVWISLQIKCMTIEERHHPGVGCAGTLSGQVSFGKCVSKVPAGTTASLDWLGSYS